MRHRLIDLFKNGAKPTQKVHLLLLGCWNGSFVLLAVTELGLIRLTHTLLVVL